jgi:hypothetical protein
MVSRLLRRASPVRLMLAVHLRNSISAYSIWDRTFLKKAATSTLVSFAFMATDFEIISLFGGRHSRVDAVEFEKLSAGILEFTNRREGKVKSPGMIKGRLSPRQQGITGSEHEFPRDTSKRTQDPFWNP